MNVRVAVSESIFMSPALSSLSLCHCHCVPLKDGSGDEVAEAVFDPSKDARSDLREREGSGGSGEGKEGGRERER